MTTRRMAGLDGLRALAILAVILWHTATYSGYGVRTLGALRPVAEMGWCGVDLFFALSGYLITRLILEEESVRGGPFRLGHFYFRRALRILPPFYLVFAVNLALAWTLAPPSVAPIRALSEADALAALPYATFWGNYAHHVLHPQGAPGAAFEVFWSLCVEEHFYLLWPALLLATPRRGPRLLVGLLVCAALPVHRALVSFTMCESPGAIHMLSHHRIDSILWGACAALAGPALAERPGLRRGALLAAAAPVVLLVTRGDLGSANALTWVGHSVGFTALAMAAALLVTEVVGAPESSLSRALEARPLRALGRVSYGVYLVHFQVMDAVVGVTARTPGPAWLRCLCAFAVHAFASYLVARALHALVDPPASACARKMGWERPKEPAATD